MATYPTLPTAVGSDPEFISMSDIDRAEDGTARVRSYGTDKAKFKVVHSYLTAAQKSTLDSFYTTNRLLPFDYTSPADAVSRSCVFAGAPSYKQEPATYYTATVQMEQV